MTPSHSTSGPQGAYLYFYGRDDLGPPYLTPHTRVTEHVRTRPV